MNTKTIVLIIKIFLIWLLIQFLIHTFVTFKLWINYWFMKYIWMRKEILIIVLWIGLLFYLYKKNNLNLLRENNTIKNLQIIIWVSIVFTFFLSLFYYQTPISNWILAFKYDYFWFIIFFLFVHLWFILGKENINKIINFYIEIIKRSLFLALLWRFIIIRKPWVLQVFFWYDKGAYEWIIWQAPPATYHTNMRYWYVRNQFLFERPITRGFRLTFFWPLFYTRLLKKKSLTKTRWRRFLYILNIFLTFSRAAWISRFVITLILLILSHPKHWKKYLFFGIIFTILSGIFIIKKWYLQSREYSTTWHIKLTLKWIKMFANKPILWNWPATAWPWTYQLWKKELEFNPENQFLQILDEFGIIWWLWWFIMYWFLIFFAYQPIRLILTHSSKTLNKEQIETNRLIIAMSIWMIWLSISWLVLHSFVDRMIVYPAMLIYWLILANYKLSKSNYKTNK